MGPDHPSAIFLDPHNILSFVNCKMSRNTSFLCYFLGLKYSSVLFITLFSSVSASWEKFPNNRAFFQGVPEGFCSRMHAGNILESF